MEMSLNHTFRLQILRGGNTGYLVFKNRRRINPLKCGVIIIGIRQKRNKIQSGIQSLTVYVPLKLFYNCYDKKERKRPLRHSRYSAASFSMKYTEATPAPVAPLASNA